MTRTCPKCGATVGHPERTEDAAVAPRGGGAPWYEEHAPSLAGAYQAQGLLYRELESVRADKIVLLRVIVQAEREGTLVAVLPERLREEARLIRAKVDREEAKPEPRKAPLPTDFKHISGVTPLTPLMWAAIEWLANHFKEMGYPLPDKRPPQSWLPVPVPRWVLDAGIGEWYGRRLVSAEAWREES